VTRRIYTPLFTLCAAASLTAAAVALPAPAHAQAGGGAAAPAAAPKFGHVDLNRLQGNNKPQQEALQQFNELRDRLAGVLKRLDQSSARFLTEQEVTELAALYEKTTPTEADKKRLGALEGKGDTQAGQLTRLQNVAAPDQAQAAQLSQLTEARDSGTANLQKVADSYDRRLKERQQELTQKALSEIRAAVAKVAQQKGLTAVFTGDVALYTQNDITDDVLKVLNGGK
jgi:Skp family chaperone for outer membrane proteins